LRAKNAAMEETLASLQAAARPQVTFDPADEFDGMSLEQLRDYITSNTGQAPLGSLNRKNLLRLARSAQPEKASAA
jgi:hypothetical protein